MRFPTAMLVAAVMLGTTMIAVPETSAAPFPCNNDSYIHPCCNIDPTYYYCAFDNHLFSDPTVAGFANLGLPGALAGCSATARTLYNGSTVVATIPATPLTGGPKQVTASWKNTKAYQVLASTGGCMYLPATAQGAYYHANIASLNGADDNLGWIISDAQVCFYDASYTAIDCQGGFVSDDGHGGPCLAQGQNDVAHCADDSITQLIYKQKVPAGAAYFDIEAPAGSVNVQSAFWQDSA